MFDAFSTPTRRAALAAVAGGFVLTLCWWFWWARPPQIGNSQEAVKTVDALFTAFTSKDPKRLADCEKRLHTLKDDGKLPDSAAKYLDGLIAKARTGNWRGAAEKLYGFMKAQRGPNA